MLLSVVCALPVAARRDDAPAHPRVYLTRADVERAKTNIQRHAWARAERDTIVRLADEWAATTTGLSNKSQIETNIEQDYAKMQAIEAQTNADIRADPSQEIKDLARAVRRLDRMALENFSGTD